MERLILFGDDAERLSGALTGIYACEAEMITRLSKLGLSDEIKLSEKAKKLCAEALSVMMTEIWRARVSAGEKHEGSFNVSEIVGRCAELIPAVVLREGFSVKTDIAPGIYAKVDPYRLVGCLSGIIIYRSKSAGALSPLNITVKRDERGGVLIKAEFSAEKIGAPDGGDSERYLEFCRVSGLPVKIGKGEGVKLEITLESADEPSREALREYIEPEDLKVYDFFGALLEILQSSSSNLPR